MVQKTIKQSCLLSSTHSFLIRYVQVFAKELLKKLSLKSRVLFLSREAASPADRQACSEAGQRLYAGIGLMKWGWGGALMWAL